MPVVVNRHYVKHFEDRGYTKVREELLMTGRQADRWKGQIILTSHPLTWRKDVNTYSTSTNLETAAECPSVLSLDFESLGFNVREAALSETYARLRGKLYKGSAALGVTLGTAKQSREMIVNRYKSLDRSASALLVEMSEAKKKGKKTSEMYLEYIFGWKPLLADIHASLLTVIQQAPTRGFISTSVRKNGDYKKSATRNHIDITETGAYTYKCSRGTSYHVDNPNLWLLERAGLLNPGAVAWDLVPWSFVVNMFVNTGQLVNTITDYAGLSFEDTHITESLAVAGQVNAIARSGYSGYPGAALSRASRRLKIRSLAGLARPPLAFRLPEVSWDLAAMAASLFTQKLGAISRLIK